MKNKKNRGFSVIELMIVLTIASILLAVSAPAFRSTLERVNANSQAKSLQSALKYARSEAIRRRSIVTVCGSSTGSDCAASSWGDGWIVYVDNTGDATGAAGSVDAGDEILRVSEELSNNISVTYPSARIEYNSQGFGHNIPTSPLQRFLICPSS